MSKSISELPHLVEKRKVVQGGRYGHIPEFPVGTVFEDRQSMYIRGMHVTRQAGIQGREASGAYSVVLSGGYEDDVDLGYEFTYTGHGGQLPLQHKDRSQKRDQEWARGNLALKMSSKLKQPVRVIRGHRLHSRWAPTEGYRYDGLYNVTQYARKPGKSGFLVCLFRFERCPGQPPLPKPIGMLPETRTLRHISPSSPSPPPTPRVPNKRKRISDAGSIPNKRRSPASGRPMFQQGSSKSTTAAPLSFQTGSYEVSPKLRQASPQMSSKSGEDFSKGPTPSYGDGEGKRKVVGIMTSGAKTTFIYQKNNNDNTYKTGTPANCSMPEAPVKAEDSSQRPLVNQEDPIEDYDDDSDLELLYPEEDETASSLKHSSIQKCQTQGQDQRMLQHRPQVNYPG